MFKFIGNILFAFVVLGAFGTFYFYYHNNKLIEVSQKTTPLVNEQVVKIATSSPEGTAVKKATDTTVKKVEAIVPEKKTTVKDTGTPGPLVVPTTTTSHDGVLTTEGVLYYTNQARQKNGGFSPLTRNAKLDQSAHIKLQDMFEKQYFDHISPLGRGPADLADFVGYQYVVVGENLALGMFENDSALVDAWMNSPGHRANILNLHYTEIGISAEKGTYEGREVWISVQSFGMPLSACPPLDGTMKEQIVKNNSEINSIQSALEARLQRVENASKADPNYNTYVDEYNELAKTYNALVATNKGLADTYNAQVRAFNACLHDTTSPQH